MYLMIMTIFCAEFAVEFFTAESYGFALSHPKLSHPHSAMHERSDMHEISRP
jgi:hypothetical protein